MVRIPDSWTGAVAALAGANLADHPVVSPMRRVPMSAYTQLVTVDLGNDGVAPVAIFAGGDASAQVGPTGTGVSWSLIQCYLSTSVGILDAALCTVYVGPLAIPTYEVAANVAGGGSQFALGGLGVAPGWSVFAQWTGGTNGAQAYLRVTGTKTAPYVGG